MDKNPPESYTPRIKICGLTRPEQAAACTALGADAIGLVFYEKSPRNVTLEQAAAITEMLPGAVSAVGVFVDPSRETLTQTVERCRLNAVQLHGRETPEFVAGLKHHLPARIIKALFTARAPALDKADAYCVSGYLVECGRGRLPGGNAEIWDWSAAKPLAQRYPLVLAGGLGPDNVEAAIAACLPDAVDASSALEVAPGIKDLKKVERFIAAIRRTEALYRAQRRRTRLIF